MKKFNPNTYSGKIAVPSSKSYLQRAIAIASLLPGKSILKGYYPSDDAKVALGIAKSLGCDVELIGDVLNISGSQVSDKKINIEVGEAGLSTRMFAPILACLGLHIEMIGEGSILTRPQDIIMDALTQLGVQVKSEKGLLPIEFQGEVSCTSLKIDGSMSSQLLTGLLIGLAVSGKGGEIQVENLKSKPYVDMTIQVLADFGFNIQNNQYRLFKIEPNQIGQSNDYTIEGDWSGASFHVVAGAISGSVQLFNLNPKSKQSDVLVLKAVKLAGAKVLIKEDHIEINKNDLSGFDLDLTEAPDLFPPICVLGLACHGITKLHGVSRLKHKESDRGKVLDKEFEKLGGRIELNGDEMWIHGYGRLSEGEIESNNDHRIAMAGTIASLIADGPIEIINEWAINKSYPTFYDDFERGAKS